MAGTIIPAEYEGSLCEIKTPENTFIATGRISAIASDKLKISVKGKAFKSVLFGSRIKINIINTSLGFRVIEGKVFTYSFGTLTLTDIFSLVEKERRRSFRVDMNMASRAHYENTYTGKADDTEIIIRNMSINGVKFTCRQPLDMGTVLSFQVQVNRRKQMELMCTIIRRGSEGSGNELSYIARLSGHGEREDEICSYLLQKQGEMFNKTK